MNKFKVGDMIWNGSSTIPYFLLIIDIRYKNTLQKYTLMNVVTGELYPMTYESAHRLYCIA
jgi:hypothetical protein